MTPLKLLMVEDSAADAELVLRALRNLPMPIEHLRVSDETALRKALAEFVPDVILSDFAMPGFSGNDALRIAKERAPHVPLIFVSGTIGEEVAVDALHHGAVDYVMKGNLHRMAVAVERALDTARQREERAHFERELRDSEARFRTIVESSHDWIWEMDADLRMTYNNPSLQRILGYAPEELSGANSLDFMHPEDRIQVLRRLPRLAAERRGWQAWRLRWLHRDGSLRVLESTASPRLNAIGELMGYRGVDHDITEQLQQEAHIQHLSRIHGVLSALGNTILRTRSRAQLLGQVCQVAVEKGGFEAACIGVPIEGGGLESVGHHGNHAVIELIGQLAALRVEGLPTAEVPPGPRAFVETRNVVIRDFATADLPARIRTQMESVGIVAQIALPIGTPPWGVLGLFASRPMEFDAEEIELLERLASEVDYALDFIAKGERLEYLAYYNPVTGLHNRIAFQKEVATRLEAGPITVAVVDLANFGRINDSRGREFGDRLLSIVGQRLQAAVGPGVVVAHPGEHTFMFARPASGTIEQEVDRLDTLLRTLDGEPYEIDGEQIYLRIHCGVALSPAHGADGESLERNATAASAEAIARNLRIESYTEVLQQRSQRRVELERNLRRAFEEDEFELFYQPKFRADTQRLSGAEALLRWRDPQAGLVSPAEFIPVLEDTGLIVQAGRWVMRTALDTALAWRARGSAGFRIAVNVSARELRNHRFLDECRELLEPHAADQLLDIEVTESLLMDDIEHSIRTLQELRALGCRIAIDDFGTGYSSLNYLVRLPVDVIKIDQSFVAQLAHSPETMSLVTNIINLAHSLSLEVVAEGVEDEEQAKLLRLLRCDKLQGYLLGRPMPAADFAERLL